MRFRYIDRKGREITLDSVEALAARIELGAVDAETDLWDASSGTWGPAESHEIYRRLVAEAASRDRGTHSSAPPLTGLGSRASGREGSQTGPPRSTGGVDGLTVAHDLDESVAAALAASAPGRQLDPPAPVAEPSTPHHPGEVQDPGIGNLEVEGLETTIVNDAAVSREPPIDGFRATVGDPWELEGQFGTDPGSSTSSPLDVDETWVTGGREPHPFDEPQPFPEEVVENGGWPAEAMLEDRRRAPSNASPPVVEVLSAPLVQWGFLAASVAVMGLFGSAVVQGPLLRGLLTAGGVFGVGLATGLLLWRDPDRRTLIPAATFGLIAVISVPLFVVGSRAQAANAPRVQPVEVVRSAGAVDDRVSVPPANPGELAMEGRALEGLIEGLDSLALAYGLGRRPKEWLQGIYLANASSYPEVEEYWTRYGEYVTEIRSRDAEGFQGSYEARLLGAGIRRDAIDELVDRGMERFRATRRRRDRLYDNMEALARASLELHALLVAREDDIEHQPFRQQGLSKAPVVEAVLKDPALEEEMWAIISRVALALESISELGETSPSRLQKAMLDSIRSSLQ